MTRILAALCSACLLAPVVVATAIAADPQAVCEAMKIKAAGKKYAGKANCAAKAVLKNEPVSAECLQKAELKFITAYLKADLKGDCSGDAAAVEEGIDACLVDLLGEITPTTTTTTTMATTTTTMATEAYSGSIRFLETAFVNPGASGTFFGQGLEVNIAFVDDAEVPGPVLQEQAGPLGCKVWEYDAAQTTAATIGIDEGPVATTATGTGAPSVPDCTFSADLGYTCPHLSTASTGGTIASGPQAGTATLTDPDVTFNNNNSLGRYVRITGAINSGNNGSFPILALAGANTIVYGNPAFVAETLPITAVHVNLAGAGPTPSVPDPGFLPDDTHLTLTHTMGGGGHVPTFSAVTTSPMSVGDDFTLATAELVKLNSVPTDGSAFSVVCDAAGCPGGSATGTLFEIVTTDAPVGGLSPFSLPAPVTKRVVVRCLVLTGASDGSTITVPAEYMDYVRTSGATRLRTMFSRVTILSDADPVVQVVGGHAVVGFTNP